jgi:hypothetical protein
METPDVVEREVLCPKKGIFFIAFFPLIEVDKTAFLGYENSDFAEGQWLSRNPSERKGLCHLESSCSLSS